MKVNLANNNLINQWLEYTYIILKDGLLVFLLLTKLKHIDMREIKKVLTAQRELQEGIVLTMHRYVSPFQEYVTAEYDYLVSKHLTI